MTHPTILDDLASQPARQTPRCWLGKLRAVSPELAEAYELAARDPRHFSDHRIAQWFRDRNVPVSDTTINVHRNGQCVTCQTTS